MHSLIIWYRRSYIESYAVEMLMSCDIVWILRVLTFPLTSVDESCHWFATSHTIGVAISLFWSFSNPPIDVAHIIYPGQLSSIMTIKDNKINEEIIRIHYKLFVVLIVLYIIRMPAEVVVLKMLNKRLNIYVIYPYSKIR